MPFGGWISFGEKRGGAVVVKRIIVYITILSLILFLFGCAAAQNRALYSQQERIDKGPINRFAQENLPSFSVSYLDNGIPVIIKKNEANRILTIKTVLLGHVALTPKEKAGLEAVTLTMLTRGSQKYSYEDVKKMLFEKSSTIAPAYESFDMTSFDLITIDTYFDELFPVYADAFLQPRWNQDEFPRIMNDFKLNKQAAENDPYKRMVIKLQERLFQGHPYAASWEGVGKSLESITLEEVKNYYETAIRSSGRIFIIAAGNFNTKDLVAKINTSFGKLPHKEFTGTDIPVFSGKVRPDLILEAFEESKGLAYVRGDFALPSPDDADYPALLTLNLLDDILYEIVITRNGAGYSSWASTPGFKANYGSIVVYQTSEPGKVKRYIDDSIDVLRRGQCLAGKVSASADGKGGIGKEVPVSERNGIFVPIAEALPFYKSQSVTRFYSEQQTNTSIAAQIASSVVYRKDFRDYLLLIDRINAITPEDIIRITRSYLTNNPILWIVLGSSDTLNDVKRDDYLKSY